ncbi:hypothetical protein PF003_g5247 [Phytophthora fragariae]|nr:hypothetical protein PF003_g5247 [Phytophthora fragariae]
MSRTFSTRDGDRTSVLGKGDSHSRRLGVLLALAIIFGRRVSSDTTGTSQVATLLPLC